MERKRQHIYKFDQGFGEVVIVCEKRGGAFCIVLTRVDHANVITRPCELSVRNLV